MLDFSSLILGSMIITFFAVSPVIVTVINIVQFIFILKNKSIKRRFIVVTDFYTIIGGAALTVLLLKFLELRDYQEALYSFYSPMLHSPIATWNFQTVLTLIIIGIIGYCVIRIKKTDLPPLLIVLMFSFMFIGMGINITFLAQLSKNINETSVMFLCLFPFNFIICCIILLKKTVAEYVNTIENKAIEYNSKFLNYLSGVLLKSSNMIVGALIIALPILIIILLILVLFGQKPDSLIKAFTDTSDWVFSKQFSPPPIQEEGHYLCTVSLRGHTKVVKPLRYGLRHGHRIVVNRQLLIANAFEEVIQLRTPRLHRFIRQNYDRYGYPLSKHIKSAWSADLVYVLMKPLEIVFLAVLYLTCSDPETRIARQYIA